MLSTHLIIGEITKPQGVRGEVKLRPITCDIERFDGLENVFLKKGDTYIPRTVRVSRIEPEAVYMYFDGVADRDAAEKLRGELVYVDRAHAAELPEEAEFICDLIGLEGITDTGKSLGKLKEVLQPGANDVYVFVGAMGEVLVPALKSVVLSVDHEARVMHLDGKRLSEVAVFDED